MNIVSTLQARLGCPGFQTVPPSFFRRCRQVGDEGCSHQGPQREGVQLSSYLTHLKKQESGDSKGQQGPSAPPVNETNTRQNSFDADVKDFRHMETLWEIMGSYTAIVVP